MQVRMMWVGFVVLCVGCASQPEKSRSSNVLAEQNLSGREQSAVSQKKAEIAHKTFQKSSVDPFEGFNRIMWSINYDVLDPYALRPVAHGYADYVPQVVRMGVNNFVHNFDEPSSMLSHLMIGDWKDAGINLLRFTLNSTVGMFGLVDVAGGLGFERRSMGFSDVLGYAEVGQGAYILLPGLGPTTLRQLAGDAVDQLYFPYSVMNGTLKLIRWGLGAVDARAKVIPQEPLLDNAVDPYNFTKGAYLQYKEGKIRQIKKANNAPQLKSARHPPPVAVNAYLNEIDE